MNTRGPNPPAKASMRLDTAGMLMMVTGSVSPERRRIPLPPAGEHREQEASERDRTARTKTVVRFPQAKFLHGEEGERCSRAARRQTPRIVFFYSACQTVR
jgi:hypothetical protein